MRTYRCMVLGLLLAAWGAGSALAAADDLVERGGVRLYPKKKRIEIDGKFCLAEGPIELLASGEGGKEYESVLSLKVDPEVLHFCLLLMGLKTGTTGPKYQGDPTTPTGSPVDVQVAWEDDKGKHLARGEDLCRSVANKAPMQRTPWVFTGSKVQTDPDTNKKVYWANVEKVVIAVYNDPFAVLNLPLAAGGDDEALVVNKQLVPKVGTKCTVILTLGVLPEPPPKPDAPK